MYNIGPVFSTLNLRALGIAALATLLLIVGVFVGSRNLQNFDAALVPYLVGTLFAAFAIVYRYVVWLQRPPTWRFFKRSFELLFQRQDLCLRLGAGEAFHCGLPIPALHRASRAAPVLGALSHVVGLHDRFCRHDPADLRMDPLRAETGRHQHVRGVRLRVQSHGVSAQQLHRLQYLPHPRLVLVDGDRGRADFHAAPADRSRPDCAPDV